MLPEGTQTRTHNENVEVETTELRAHGKHAPKEREKIRNRDTSLTHICYRKLSFFLDTISPKASF